MSGRWAADGPHENMQQVRLVLVRHGESWWNAEGRVQGQGGTGLSDLGHTQAAAVVEHLRTEFPDPAAVFSSDIERVTETAAPYLAATGRGAELDKRLREIDSGDWTGLTTSDVAARYPEEIAAIARGEDPRRGGSGENFADMRHRVGEVLREIASGTAESVNSDVSAGDPAVIVFTHGGPIRVAAAEALGLPPGGHRLLDPPVNCSITALTAVVADGVVAPIRLTTYNGVHLGQTGTEENSQDAVGETR